VLGGGGAGAAGALLGIDLQTCGLLLRGGVKKMEVGAHVRASEATNHCLSLLASEASRKKFWGF
jgi:hypothetical protein